MERLVPTNEMKELAERNAARVAEMKEKMGARHLLHPANKVTKEQYQSILRMQSGAKL